MSTRLAAIRVLSFSSMFAFWAIAASFFPPTLLPGPLVVAHRLSQLILSGEFLQQAYGTITRVLVGFTFAFVVSIALGVAMGLRRTAAALFEGYVLVGLTIPGLCWSVLAVMWFGVTELAPVFSIFIVTLPMLTLNMWQGTNSLDKDLLEMARLFKVPKWSLLVDVILPQMLPFCLAGARLGFALGWKVVVLSELFGLSSGIGYMINRAFSSYSMDDVLAWTLGFTLIMFIVEYAIFVPVERRLVRWRPALAA
jgi:NitT/TauT family transport system permease protein